jgi:hypothetical protein
MSGKRICRKKLMIRFDAWVDAMRAVIFDKNQDYGDPKDAMGNLNGVELLGESVHKGIFIRMLDKVYRLGSFYKKGFCAVKDESVYDTMIDLCNYAFLWSVAKGLEEEEKEDEPERDQEETESEGLHGC